VYKSLNMDTGDVVAIKQVPLHNIPKEELAGLCPHTCRLMSDACTAPRGARQRAGVGVRVGECTAGGALLMRRVDCVRGAWGQG